MFYSVDILRTSSPRDSITSNSERTASRRRRGKPGRIGVLAGGLNIKTLLPIKENQISQTKEFRAFLCMGRRKCLDWLKSFLGCTPQLSGASILCFHILNSLRASRGQGLQSDGCGMTDVLCFLHCLRAHQLTVRGVCNHWWRWHHLFTDVAGSVLLLRFQWGLCTQFWCVWIWRGWFFTPPSRWLSWLSCNSTPFWHELPGNTVRSHRLRALS